MDVIARTGGSGFEVGAANARAMVEREREMTQWLDDVALWSHLSGANFLIYPFYFGGLLFFFFFFFNDKIVQVLFGDHPLLCKWLFRN